MSSPDYGNVPAQPVYGEVKEIDAQVAGAPLPEQEEPGVAAPAPAPAPPEPGYRPAGNMTSVLPPKETSPAYTGQRPLAPEQEVAYLILGTPGMSNIARSFASQIVGRFRAENPTADNLSEEDLRDYRLRSVAALNTPPEEATEDTNA